MKCDNGTLQGYLDNALLPQEHAAVEEHLASCAACREDLAALRQQGMDMAGQLTVLDPPAARIPDGRRAMARFWAQAQPARPTGRAVSRPWRWRWATAAVAAVAIVAVLFSIAPVRQAAADLLGIFRVQKFTVIPVDPARLEQLASMEDMIEGILRQITVLREPGEPQKVSDAAAASATAGFAVQQPGFLPDGAVQEAFYVASGPKAEAVIDREQLGAMLTAAGVQDITLPEVDQITVTVDSDNLVVQEYRVNGRFLEIVQAPSPEVTLVPEVDLANLGQAMLEFVGVAPAEARRLAQEIDWASTLVIPLPTNVAQFREVQVNGVTGLMLEGIDPETTSENVVILWERDGIVYAVSGSLSADVLLSVANSLR